MGTIYNNEGRIDYCLSCGKELHVAPDDDLAEFGLAAYCDAFCLAQYYGDKKLFMGTEVECAWCGAALLAEDAPYRMKHHNTEQMDHLCSDRCEMRHYAYAAQCKCGWWHSDIRCPKCGVAQ